MTNDTSNPRLAVRQAWVGKVLRWSAALLAVSACDRAPTASAETVDLASVVPAEAPYMTGTIASAAGQMAGSRVLVERAPGALATGALVSTWADLPVYWRSGRRASVQDLRVGRRVTVWVSGGELRSMPPQVGASIIVIEH